jgi:hypothetical protein
MLVDVGIYGHCLCFMLWDGVSAVSIRHLYIVLPIQEFCSKYCGGKSKVATDSGNLSTDVN